jgi:DNA-binding MarR family transcriptional regulator
VLVDQGFATWKPNPRHRRAKLLKTTRRARPAIRRVLKRQRPWSTDVGDAIGVARLRRAAQTLQAILDLLQDPEADAARWTTDARPRSRAAAAAGRRAR